MLCIDPRKTRNNSDLPYQMTMYVVLCRTERSKFRNVDGNWFKFWVFVNWNQNLYEHETMVLPERWQQIIKKEDKTLLNKVDCLLCAINRGDRWLLVIPRVITKLLVY